MDKAAVTITKILTWTEYFWKHNLKPRDPVTPGLNENVFKPDPLLNGRVSLWEGDITTLDVDAIVNAANRTLLGGGGIDGAIHAAAGPNLLSFCIDLHGCSTGESKISPGFQLPAKHIIHTVGPADQNREALASCYKSSLQLLVDNKLTTIAIPCIATGIFGYPNEEAAHVALQETRQFLQENSQVTRVIFCTFLKTDTEIYEELMQRYFPVINRGCTPEESMAELAKRVDPDTFRSLTSPAKVQEIPLTNSKV